MEGSNPPEEVKEEQTEPAIGQVSEGPTPPVPTDFRRNVWLLVIIFAAVTIAWVLSLLWKRAPQQMANLPQGAAFPEAGSPLPPAQSGLPAPRRLEAALPPPSRVSVARIIGTQSEVIQAAPPLFLPSGGLTYRLAREFDVTNRAADFQL